MFIEKSGLDNILGVFKKNSVPFKFVGGCVRDRLLGHQISDIDIATPEKPENIKNVFLDPEGGRSQQPSISGILR